MPYYFFAILVSLLAFWIFQGYLEQELLLLFGLCLFPIVLIVRRPGRGSWRYALLALFWVGLHIAIPTRTFMLLIWACSIFFIVENWKGKINEVPLVLALFLTSGIKSLSVILGFEIRLWMSRGAAQALQIMDANATAIGNQIHFQSGTYAVDPECLGLQMLEVSLFFICFLLAFFERRTSRFLPRWAAGASLLAAFLFNLVFNQLRIILLVVLDIPPETMSHDLAGLMGLLAYVFLPLFFLVRWLHKKYSKTTPGSELTETNLPAQKLVRPVQILLIGFLLYFTIREFDGNPSEYRIKWSQLALHGLPTGIAKDSLGDGILRYKNDSLLIYVKPIPGFYKIEHSPLICWRGSGYRLGASWTANAGDLDYFVSTLQKDSSLLYTAWWYDNGLTQTIGQGDWRWANLNGQGTFSLVNVTSNQLDVLNRQVKRMYTQK